MGRREGTFQERRPRGESHPAWIRSWVWELGQESGREGQLRLMGKVLSKCTMAGVPVTAARPIRDHLVRAGCMGRHLLVP